MSTKIAFASELFYIETMVFSANFTYYFTYNYTVKDSVKLKPAENLIKKNYQSFNFEHDFFKHRGEAELRITCYTTKIALQASRQERKSKPKVQKTETFSKKPQLRKTSKCCMG